MELWYEWYFTSQILCDANTGAEADIVVPSPEGIHDNMGVMRDAAASATAFMDHNYWCAEVCLKLGRYEEALSHVDYYEEHCCHTAVLTWAPWLRARILAQHAAKANAPTSSAEYAEAAQLFEKAAAAAVVWESPTMVALALQDYLALVPAAKVNGDIKSRWEEAVFDVTMETDTPMRRHIESGDAFPPKSGA